MRIQELAERSHLTAHTIRFYEKEGLLDDRHVRREPNNYRDYSDEALARLRLIKKFQGIGCSLAELKEVLRDHDVHVRTDLEVIDWIHHKLREIERRKDGCDQMLVTLHLMLDHWLAVVQRQSAG